jgi:osmotically-inducible protein OsmY
MSRDKDLKQAVLAELDWEPSIVAARIGVAAEDGVVTLSGHVDNYPAKSAAEAAAGRVKGVKAIAEEIEVRLPDHVKRSDEEIAAAAIERLAWNGSLPRGVVKVTVEKGWVSLSGQLEWHFQREQAASEVRTLSGVIGVSDEMIIKPKLNAANISEDISRALHRSWYDRKTIQVTAEAGRIELSGSVNSRRDREEAEMAAWAAPGATSVENNITIN